MRILSVLDAIQETAEWLLPELHSLELCMMQQKPGSYILEKEKKVKKGCYQQRY